MIQIAVKRQNRIHMFLVRVLVNLLWFMMFLMVLRKRNIGKNLQQSDMVAVQLHTLHVIGMKLMEKFTLLFNKETGPVHIVAKRMFY